MSRMYRTYVGNKKILPWTISTIPTVDQSDVSLQQPTSTNITIADHDCRRRKWPPSAPHEALRSAPAWHLDRRQPPKHADIILGAVKGVCGPQNTPMLWRFIIAGTKECLEGHTHPQPPPKIHLLAGGGCNLFIRSISAERKASCGALGGHFCRRQPWLWRLWCQLCFVIRLLKLSIKTLMLVVCNQYLYELGPTKRTLSQIVVLKLNIFFMCEKGP
jgi:hypothetical protein